jgi:hypothetical protein
MCTKALPSLRWGTKYLNDIDVVVYSKDGARMQKMKIK